MTSSDNPFDWSGGHPALDLVNTLDERPFPEPVERLRNYADLVCFAARAGLLDSVRDAGLRQRAGPACERVAGRARRVRETLHTILVAWQERRAIPDKALRSVTLAIRRARAARRLVATDGARGVARYAWVASGMEVPLHACALAAEDLLTATDPARIRVCGAPDCGVFFLDTSKGGRRHWCSMGNCGNREKQRRWRSGSG